MQQDMWTKLNTLIRDVQGFLRRPDANATDSVGKLSHLKPMKTRKLWSGKSTDNSVIGIIIQIRVPRSIQKSPISLTCQNTSTSLLLTSAVKPLIMKKRAVSAAVIGLEPKALTRTRGGYAIIPASGNCFDGKVGVSVTAHELGHAFGLEHDFRNDAYVMSYGAAPNRLSKCAARWLDVNRFFNANQTAFNEPTAIQMLTPSAYLPNARNLTLQFEVTDVDGIHQVQLLVPVTSADPASGIKLHSCKGLNAQSSTLEFYASTLTAHRVSNIVLQVIDVHGNIAPTGLHAQGRQFPIFKIRRC